VAANGFDVDHRESSGGYTTVGGYDCTSFVRLALEEIAILAGETYPTCVPRYNDSKGKVEAVPFLAVPFVARKGTASTFPS
jgi:hypothetical protein